MDIFLQFLSGEVRELLEQLQFFLDTGPQDFGDFLPPGTQVHIAVFVLRHRVEQEVGEVVMGTEQFRHETGIESSGRSIATISAKGAKRANDGAFRHMAEHDDGIKVPDESFDVRHR